MRKEYYIIIAIIMLIAGAGYYIVSTQSTITRLSVELDRYKNLSKDTVFIPGKVDTVFKSKVTEKKVYIPVKTDRDFDTLIVVDAGSVRVHSIDSSICVDINLAIKELEIIKTDTLRIPVFKEIIIEKPKEFDYKLLSVGLAAGAAITLGILQIFR